MRATLIAAFMCAAAVSSALAQGRTRPWSLDMMAVRYDTGDRWNCPTGYGVGLDVERRVGPGGLVGALLGIRVANAIKCKVSVPDAHLALDAAPVLALSVEPTIVRGGTLATLGVRVGTIFGRASPPNTGSAFLLMLQADLAVRHGGFGLIARFGVIRTPVNVQAGTVFTGVTVSRSWRWRRWFEVGPSVYF